MGFCLHASSLLLSGGFLDRVDEKDSSCSVGLHESVIKCTQRGEWQTAYHVSDILDNGLRKFLLSEDNFRRAALPFPLLLLSVPQPHTTKSHTSADSVFQMSKILEDFRIKRCAVADTRQFRDVMPSYVQFRLRAPWDSCHSNCITQRYL